MPSPGQRSPGTACLRVPGTEARAKSAGRTSSLEGLRALRSVDDSRELPAAASSRWEKGERAVGRGRARRRRTCARPPVRVLRVATWRDHFDAGLACGSIEPAPGCSRRWEASRRCWPSSASRSQVVRRVAPDARVRHPDRHRRTSRCTTVAGASAKAARITTISIGIGLLLAIGAGQFLQGVRYRVDGIEPAVLVTAPLILLAALLSASCIPALRATRVDATVAMRAE